MSETLSPKKERPLSPHLQIYKPQITSATSIFHRISGIALSIGLLFFVCGLVSLADGRESYDAFVRFANSVIGQILLIGWSGAFFYHMCAGIRHFFLDAGYGYDKSTATKVGLLTVGMAIALTIILWGAIYGGLI